MIDVAPLIHEAIVPNVHGGHANGRAPIAADTAVQIRTANLEHAECENADA